MYSTKIHGSMSAVLTSAWYLPIYLADILPPLRGILISPLKLVKVSTWVSLLKTLKQHNEEVYTQLAMPQSALVKGQSLAVPCSKYLLALITGVHFPEHSVHQKSPSLPIKDLFEQVSQDLLCWDVRATRALPIATASDTA